MPEFNFEDSRQNIYQSLIEKLSKKAFNSLDANGISLMDPKEGAIWDGAVLYVIGELKRVLKINLLDYHQKNIIKLSKNIVSQWKSKSEIDTCFMGMGLSAWGKLNEDHAIYSLLDSTEKENLTSQLKVTREFKNNWEAFNACIEGANSILLPLQKNTLPIHLGKILDKFKETGYHDDSDGLGVYDSYGLMSLNYCIKAIELLDNKNEIKKAQLELFKPHCIRYAELIKDLIYPDGSGWPFGRSVGVLGQLQYIAFLEQCLYHNFLNKDLADWARGATKKCVIKMIELFWNSEKQWFCFRDEFHTCYGYRNTYPMHWDLLRYFTQIFEYSSADKQGYQNLELKPEKKCKEIITNPKRKTSIFVWSDGNTQMVIPIMNSSMKNLSADYLPKPHCRGLIEGITEGLKPIWVPSFIINDKTYYPTNRFLNSHISHENGWDIYHVFFNRLYESPKEDPSFSGLMISTQFCFTSNKFKRIDTLVSQSNLQIDAIQMEVLQSAPHPKRPEGYGKVYQIQPILKTDISNVTVSEKISIENDLNYRNFFGHPSHKWIIMGKDIELKKETEYKLAVEITWE